jgi:tRNA (cmo5U34)-methyltransferase
MMQRSDAIWKSAVVTKDFLEGMRGAIPLAAEQLAVMVRIIQSACPNLKNFLDLGCGDGVLAQAVLAHYPDAHGVLLDFSEPMIEAARHKLASCKENLTFVVQDYGTAQWLGSLKAHVPFDAVISGFSIHHQPDERKRELYQEIFDLLKPGIETSREQTAHEYHNRPHKEANILAPLELQCDWLREIGFDHVDCYLKIFELALFGGVRPGG